MAYTIYGGHSGIEYHRNLDLATTAGLCHVEPYTIEGTIEEWGRCDVVVNNIDWVVVEAGDDWPGPYNPNALPSYNT